MPRKASSKSPRLAAASNGSKGALNVHRLPVRMESDDTRVITLPFLGGGADRLRKLIERVAEVNEQDVDRLLEEVRAGYSHRHTNLDETFGRHARSAFSLIGREPEGWADARLQLLGAYVTMEYSIDAAALFNPSIVPHPDQTEVPKGATRFVLSLRATGEGHVSSIVFRTGVIQGKHKVELDPPGKRFVRGRIRPDKVYVKSLLQRRLKEMNALAPGIGHVLGELPDEFGYEQLLRVAERVRSESGKPNGGQSSIDTLLWLARSNYHIDVPASVDLSELVIFPIHEYESRGIEDLRLVRFVEDDGKPTYIGTYTAYNGTRIMPMLLQTDDFYSIEVHSLNGKCAINKGMALFPRKIGGHYVMCSRIDGENLFIAYSDYLHFWESAQPLTQPREPWELRQLGNCGSPIETDEGWLLLTHGVGPMRGYCIGAMLLDLEDPLKVRGQLRQPLLSPLEDEREGYVPNVVYTCGAMEHNGRLYLPYAQADKSASFAVVRMDKLIDRLLDSPLD